MNIFRQFKRYLIYKLKLKTNIDGDLHEGNVGLDKLFRYYNSDKGVSYINSSHKLVRGHNYSNFYEKHFEKIKNKKINILEIGVFSGASSSAFATYFKNATIYCIDINLTSFKYKSKKFKIFGLDVSNKKMLNNFLKKNNIEDEYFDIIIDDASHRQSDQIRSLFFFYKHLRSKGIYVIEEFKFPNKYPHLNDYKNEYKTDEVLDFINNEKVFKSNLVEKESISNLIKNLKKISIYKGHHLDSDIAFIEKK